MVDGKLKNTCKVVNGYVHVGDIVTILSYGNENRYLYRVTRFGEYEGKPQVYFRAVIPPNLEFRPDTLGSAFDFPDAAIDLKIIYKKGLFGRLKRV